MNQQPLTYQQPNKILKTTRKTTITKQQIRILRNIYYFRFLTTYHLQIILDKKQIQQVQQRLNLLLKRQYIGRNFSSSDRLTGAYASYYLLPKGLALLKSYEKQLSKRALHNIYKDKTASIRFINHCLDVATIFNEFNRIYPDDIGWIPRSNLADADYLPDANTDAHIYIKHGGVDPGSNYLLFYIDEATPFFVHRKNIKELLGYVNDETWKDSTGDDMPKLIFICQSSSLHKRFVRYLIRYLEDSYVNFSAYSTCLSDFIGSQTSSKIWINPEIIDENDHYERPKLITLDTVNIE